MGARNDDRGVFDYLITAVPFQQNGGTTYRRLAVPSRHTVQLGKKPPKHLRHWVDFFNGKPIAADAPDYIKQAYGLVDYANLDDKERKMISAQERREQDIIGQRNHAVNKARAEVALNLLADKMSPAKVAELTGLSIQEITALVHA